MILDRFALTLCERLLPLLKQKERKKGYNQNWMFDEADQAALIFENRTYV